MKQILLIFLIVALISASDKTILKSFINGLFVESKLPEPITVMDCIDDRTAENTVSFIPSVLYTCGKAKSVFDFKKIAEDVTNWMKTIPKPVQDCLSKNKEISNLCKAYDCMNVSISKVIFYITMHAKDVAAQCRVIETAWKKGNFTEAGRQTAKLAKQILKEKQIRDDKKILLQVLNGIFEQSSMADPITIMDCIDAKTAENIVAFAPTPLHDCANAKSIFDFKKIGEDVQKFAKTIPKAVTDCLSVNKELNDLCAHYDCKNLDITHIVTYVTFHAKKIAGECKNMETLWKGGQFTQFGKAAAQLFQEIIKVSLGDDKKILQEVLNGVFEQSSMKDPVTVMDCIDGKTAENIVAFVPTPLHDCAAAKSIFDFRKIADDAQKFAKTIPKEVTDCLSANKELNDLCAHYDCKNLDITHIVTYITFHAKKIAGECKNMETLWKSGKFLEFGKKVTELVQEVIKMSLEDDKKILQQILDGVFEQSQMADPKTLLDCVDAKSAESIVAYIPSPLHDCAQAKSIFDFKRILEDAAKFAETLPKEMIDCLQTNKDVQDLCTHYDCTHIDIAHVVSYITFHAKKIAGECKNMEKQWQSGQFKELGIAGAQLFQEVIRETQEMYN